MDVMPLSDVSDMHVPSHCEKPFSSDFCQEFIGAFVRCAAGVVAGIKPGALYSFEVVPHCESCLSRACPAVQYRAMMCDFAREVELFGVKIVPISPLHKRIHFLVDRTEHVKSIISEKQSREFLRERGFASSSWQDIMRDFRVRLTRYHCGLSREYPHEIGLILGYPLEDVKGFISGACETCRGPWRAYGNAAAAQKSFERLAFIEHVFRTRFSQGESLFELLQSAGDIKVSAA